MGILKGRLKFCGFIITFVLLVKETNAVYNDSSQGNVTGCGDVPDIDNGVIVSSVNSTYGSQVNVTCDQGFTADKSYITCLTSGDWDNVTCIRTESCGEVPEIENGVITNSDNSSFYGSQANVTCDQGFTADKSNITCLSSGNWDNVTCIRTGCSDVPDIENGSVFVIENSTFGSQANVTCDPGFTADKHNISCLTSGYWENVTCISAESCGEVPEIENGVITNSDNSSFYGSQANVTCDQGFTADKSNITCLSSGNWDNVTCIRTGCSDVPDIENGSVFVIENSTFGSQANVTCDPGFTADKHNISCLTSGYWENVTCISAESCGEVPEIENGVITNSDNSSFYGSQANVTCDQGFTADKSNITCLSSGNWDNATCIRTGCGNIARYLTNGEIELNDPDNTAFGALATVRCNANYAPEFLTVMCNASGEWENASCYPLECNLDNLPVIANGEVIFDSNGNQTTASSVNVSCNHGYAATSPVVTCQGGGQWQDNVFCVFYDLGVAIVQTGQTIHNGQYTGYFKCAFTIADGLKYRIKWYVHGFEFYDTGIITSTDASISMLSDDMFSNTVTSYAPFSEFFNLQVKCSAAVYDGAGETEHENITSIEMTPLQISTNSITMMRGKEATFTVYLNFPFGCSTDTPECALRFIVYDPNDSYHCYDSSIAVIHSDTCGGKVDGATPATLSHVSTANTFTNITITTKNNRWYRLRWRFSLVLKLAAVGNSKALWNSPSTSVSVTVTENYYARYRGCYSFVDPYIYTFDRRWYSNQLLEEFVLYRHKTLPIEVQTVTAGCNRWATCSCAVTVRAGGDVFTINHCSGHLSTFLSAKDGILKVYRLWSTYYRIILPTGTDVYVYVMSYFNYMMNVYVVPTPSDFEQTEGLCGNFNGDFRDDTILRGTTQSDPVESSYGYWWWWSDYFFPHQFAYSWGLLLTGRQDESLLNPDVYENVESWDSNKKLCVCPYASSGSSYDAMCSADEEALCTGYVWHWGTRVSAQTRSRRDVEHTQKHTSFETDFKKRLQRMRSKWEILREQHVSLRKKREVNNRTTIPIEEAEQMCEEQLNNNCNTYSKKDDVSDVAESNDTLENCARDTAISGTTEWVTPHCDAITQKVTVEIEKDVEFAENNTELVNNIKENACPSNCSGHGQCVNQTCVCFQDFGTDLCLLNLTLGPLIEELADEGICDVSTGNECDFILIVGNGFVDTAKCKLAVYVAGIDGNFNMTEEFEINCAYINYNELYALVPEITNSSDNTNTTLISRMLGISVSNDGTNFGPQQTVVVLDTTCQERQTNPNNETIVTLKSGYCFIVATCYTAGTYLNGSSCAKCDTSQNLFVWTDVCDNDDDTNENYLIIVLGSVGGVILLAAAVALVVFIKLHLKAKGASTIVPLVETSLGPSKMKFWYRKNSNVGVVEHHLGTNKARRPSAAEYFSNEVFPNSSKEMTSDNW
ncbi:uncharacterized protein LOC132715005 isoform X4 [Ruditapes philippinarum]|uniref:uncharacterized protein LOC132715005 isoform X4 n=1 Tax=Ruditapes philippinarum TaxID=129788 RepID=UPI00295AE503|nr:uncharacterized protein LOC132715005 isoform X4 [Ruditapes philippinarum]